MTRLTKRVGENITYNQERKIECSVYCDECSQGTANCKTVREMIKKLADYEDAEHERKDKMKVKRTIKIEKPEKYEVGDIIKFKLKNGSKVEALAVKEEDNNMLFCFVDCLTEKQCMNETNTTEGGFEASKLDKYLNKEVIDLFPDKVKKNMVQFNNRYLRIPTEREIFGEAEYGNEPDTVEQWKPMKRRRNRIAGLEKDGTPTWYWLASVASSALFCCCNGNGGADYGNASSTAGVRPVFLLKNL